MSEMDPNDKRALNTAISGLKVSASHMRRLATSSVIDAGLNDALNTIITSLEAVRETERTGV